MGFDSVCDTAGLVLRLGLTPSPSFITLNTMGSTKGVTEAMHSFEPSLTLSLSNKRCEGAGSQDSGVCSSLSSVKREREAGSEEAERGSNDNNNYSGVRNATSVDDDVEDDDGRVNGRKKLRLTKPQSALLEEAFKHHSSLNLQKQKQELARRLKLRPRQVEVWFQNRRARTKLKQTELEFEHLKKYCDKLTCENWKLQKELQELKALKSTQPLYMQLPAAGLTVCPSCERIGDTKSPAVKNPFNLAAKPHGLNSFTNPSAAC